VSESPFYAVTVPCVHESMVVLEGLCETFLSENNALRESHAFNLQMAVVEGCKNALAQTGSAGRLNITALSFYRSNSNSDSNLIVEIRDPGPGLQIGGAKPPYPISHIASEFVIGGILEQDVVATVLSPYVVSLRKVDGEFDAANAVRAELLDKAKTSGMGLLILCSTWGRVVFEYDPNEGNILRLSSPVCDSVVA